jgi:hypothetical protein
MTLFPLKYCPICNKENGGCKVSGAFLEPDGTVSEDTETVLCRVGNPDSPYRLLGGDEDSWYLHAVPTKDIDFTPSSGRGKYNRNSNKIEYEPHTSPWFQRWLSENYKAYEPATHSKEFLESRGIDPHQAYLDGFREITKESYQLFFREPREQKNLPEWSLPLGTFIPCKDIHGNVVHGQIRPITVREGTPKYLWMRLHPYSGNQYREPQSYAYHGTKPGTFWRGESLSDLCVIVEGSLKPYVVHSNLQKKYHVYGASGGQWTSNAKYLEELKEGLRNLGVTKLLLLPDSNSRANKDVWRNCEKLRVWAENNGFTFILGDWGHLDGKFDNQDPDEISPNQLNGIVQRFGKPRNPAELLAIKEVKGKYKPKLLVDKANNSLDFKDWVSRFSYSDTRFHLLNTPMGTGKSWLVEELHSKFDVNVIYISQSPRDLPTEYLAKNAYVPPSRHDGLVNTGRRDPIGNLIYRRPKSKDEVPDTSASCLKAAEHALALKNGVPPAKLCRECPAFHGCLDGSDPDYTYLYDKIQGIKNHTLIATSVAGFSDKLIPDNGKETFIIVDECSQNMQPLEVIPLNSDEFTSLDRRFTLIVDENDRFVPLTAPTLVDVEDAERIDTQNLQNAMHGKGKASQYGKLVKGLMSNGYIVDDNGLKLICRSPQVSKILECTKATKVILMDATASKAVLEAELGITVEDYGAQDLSVNSVQIQVFLHPGASKFRITPEAFEFAKSIKKENWAILGACDLVGKDGIGFFRDSRGSNAAQEKDGLVIAGMPLPNLGGLKLKYSILEEPSITFNEYYQAHVQAELLQAIGRLRGYRRQGENLTVRIVCHTNLDWLREYGYQVFYRAVPELTEKYTWLFQAQTEVPVSGYYRDSLSTPVTTQKSMRLGVLLESNQDLNRKALEYGFTALGAFDKTFIPYKDKFLDVVRKRLAESRSVCYS